ncbi:hypothetical protein GCM10009846_08930 [Agrococcus versicolor]|uniref:Uncharacterized protein n=1 Tax=Agrococcus versicolor TaxID=501482 RepID=A0ABP5MC75_9MICO
MSTSGAVRAIRERAMGRMRAEQDPAKAVAYALAGLWDAVEVLSLALDDVEHVDAEARAELEHLVRSLPARLASVDDEGLATAAVAEHLAEVLSLRTRAHRVEATPPDQPGRRRCGA